MKLAEHVSFCGNCGDKITPGDQITQDEDSQWVHADGCLTGDWLDAQLTRSPETKLKGYKGAKLSACPKCHLTHSAYVECD